MLKSIFNYRNKSVYVNGEIVSEKTSVNFIYKIKTDDPKNH